MRYGNERISTGVTKSRGLLYRLGEGKNRSREASWGANAVVKVRDDGGLNWKWVEKQGAKGQDG